MHESFALRLFEVLYTVVFVLVLYVGNGAGTVRDFFELIFTNLGNIN